MPSPATAAECILAARRRHGGRGRRSGTWAQVDLIGTPAEATWDAELAPAMNALGIALREEAALDLLLEDLG